MLLPITTILFLILKLRSIHSTGLFDIQRTQTILCSQFPLVSTINDSSLQCARLRMNENVQLSDSNIYNSSPILLFIIVNQSSSTSSPLNLIINFTESLDFPLLVNEIRLGILVIQSNFTINNQSELLYSSYDIPTLNWKNSNSNVYDLFDIVHLDSNENENDLYTMCQWTFDRWNQIFNGNSSNKSSFVHILTTENADLMFTIMNPTNLVPPAPYLNILHCFPYRLETTELVLVLCSMFIFIVLLTMLIFLHCRKEEYQFFSKLTMKQN
ncbi:unnamed protein product [Rotaria magnacalcarata]|uniref:Uncharacterized protein n=1 Tax=Rotaria magnacalcarata TaxID=392030 RepID=A0A815ZCQ6_9BILA|nr:unnamed protein product [Rotaria magnacalcarata]CAF1583131.1 unnamed protein product [Rotaria magnacalcarata]CAF4643696.1 unnamed protein product [Rotaria magnacalcarata]CAF4742394.1 unnamed protein product [Rotaria magnacalcarata]